MRRSAGSAESTWAGGRAPPHASVRPNRVLMLATIFNMPYRILRCAQASGAEVYALGNAGARALRHSRHCRRFVLSETVIFGGRDEGLALEINCLVRELGIDMVIPGCAPSTRALIANRDLIEAPCFPLPTLEQFDALNNKWEFARLCRELGILMPETRLLPDASALAREIKEQGLPRTLVAKPLSRSGEGGIVVLDGTDTEARLEKINYRPVLVQAFIPGKDIGASVYANGGKIEAFIAHRLWHQVYSVLHDSSILPEVDKVVRHLRLDGVYNFDMRLAPDGAVYYLECNPRFFYKINLSMLAGINFVERGLPGARPPGNDLITAAGDVRLPKALAYSLVTSARCTRRDWAMAGYLYLDPVPYAMERLNLTV